MTQLHSWNSHFVAEAGPNIGLCGAAGCTSSFTPHWYVTEAQQEGRMKCIMPGFLRFQDFSPYDATFTGIHSCKGEEYQRCSHIVNRQDRDTAAKLSLKIQLLEDGLLQDLRQYAELCCCKQSHRKRARKVVRLDRMALEWLSELAGHLYQNPTTAAGLTRLPRFSPTYRKGRWTILNMPFVPL